MDTTKPTTQLLGRFQPWHQGHTELFRRALAKTGQVAILLREQDGTEKNPFDFKERAYQISYALDFAGYQRGKDYEIYLVPNITHITYGRDVGYTIEQEHLGEDLEAISASKIREKILT